MISLLKSKAFLFVLLFLLVHGMTGCRWNQNGYHKDRIVHIKRAVKVGNYNQASKFLDNCVNNKINLDYHKCIELNTKILSSGKSRNEYFKSDYLVALEEEERLLKEAFLQMEREEKKEQMEILRTSPSPWDKYTLAIELHLGNAEEKFSGEIGDVIGQAFIGFGVCAKEVDTDCMTQYARMILSAVNNFPDKATARKAALYWLNLSARYGNNDARKVLISLGEPVPTPDLAMEELQRTANDLSRNEIRSNEELERKRLFLEREMLNESRKQSRIQAASFIMQNFVNRSLRCTSNTFGGTTFTNCR